jgi:hypothetical protein
MQFSLRLVTPLQSHPALLALPSVLLLVESNNTVTMTVSGHSEVAGSTLMVSVDNGLIAALHCKGNATVTSAYSQVRLPVKVASCLYLFRNATLHGRNQTVVFQANNCDGNRYKR